MMNEKPVKGFDFHCHIDLYPDPPAIIAKCSKDQIITLAVTTTPKAWPQNCRWAENSNYVKAAVGLHPELVGERYREIELLETYIKESNFVGEVGLDGSSQYRKSSTQQMDVFQRVLRQSQRLGGRVVSIHSRRAADDVVETVRQCTTPGQTLCILHWFSGSIRTAQRAAALGCYFSVNHQMLEHDSGAALVRSLPQDRLLTETDGPFTSQGAKKSEPPDVVATSEKLANARRLPISEMEKIIAANATRVFQFPSGGT
jgi:TatD DNase family protein